MKTQNRLLKGSSSVTMVTSSKHNNTHNTQCSIGLLKGSVTMVTSSEINTSNLFTEKMVNGCYTRMLRMALNINQYGDHVSNHSLYGELAEFSSKITQRRLRLARHPELTLNKLILWKRSHGHCTNRGDIT